MKLQLLGCGTSSGVPRVGNDWGDCDPAEPRNRRLRASVLVSHGDTSVLVDTGPDLREQLLAADISDVSGVIWTHDHADHCHGIDDLRQLYHARGAPVAGYARAETLESLRTRFAYALAGKGDYPPVVAANLLPDAFAVGELAIRIVDQPHGDITSAGVRFEAVGKSVVYSTDFNILTDEMAELFEGADLWVVDALRRRPHPTHPHLAQTLEWIAALGVRRAVLTHLDQSMDYLTLRAELPAHVEPGYDGMEIDL